MSGDTERGEDNWAPHAPAHWARPKHDAAQGRQRLPGATRPPPRGVNMRSTSPDRMRIVHTGSTAPAGRPRHHPVAVEVAPVLGLRCGVRPHRGLLQRPAAALLAGIPHAGGVRGGHGPPPPGCQRGIVRVSGGPSQSNSPNSCEPGAMSAITTLRWSSPCWWSSSAPPARGRQLRGPHGVRCSRRQPRIAARSRRRRVASSLVFQSRAMLELDATAGQLTATPCPAAAPRRARHPIGTKGSARWPSDAPGGWPAPTSSLVSPRV